MRKRLAAAAVGAVMAASLAGCGSDDSPTIRVLAAASLVDVLKPLVAAYEQANPGASVQVDTGASSALVQKLESGATGDVLVTADEATMTKAVDAGVARDPKVVATNRLVIVVPNGNPGKVADVRFFAVPGNRAVVCAREVPCGAAAEKAIAAVGGTPQPISRATDVRAALGSVTSGEADAALVYATDAASAGDRVETIAIPDAPVNRYPASALTDAGASFVALLAGPDGQRIFREAGFGPA
ncbi:molybdate ABC transporter substrate binding protein [Gordonia araii NBRC 100433]|uniref:Molybdate ABC transporter substrate binding protein n=1 Tax=Gordonia araii NBRC 100433 TaxID=1073574 RepID=G7H114_9ACTN|nr:molybdate ABC transporter substrate-binding protein [Gordonia araii]NNG96737.1 molybdate ABC transporter substrate-binding protein [Gordonia araii NBRC 100433]GAB09575.1 molybdate ABC transporter substrate binding protein [Gordonia araii NBRC 100433]